MVELQPLMPIDETLPIVSIEIVVAVTKGRDVSLECAGNAINEPNP